MPAISLRSHGGSAEDGKKPKVGIKYPKGRGKKKWALI